MPKTSRVVMNPPIVQPMMIGKLLDSNGSKRKKRGCVYNGTNMINNTLALLKLNKTKYYSYFGFELSCMRVI